MKEKALIAEDNDDMRDLLQEALEYAGYETLVAANGRQALAHIEKENEMIDCAVHEMSGRKGAFVPVNCAAIPAELIESELFGHTGSAFTGAKQPRAGLIEASDCGTIFLDEVGELPPPAQPKLLRSLQEGAVRRVGTNIEKAVDLRVVAATNRDLEQDVRDS